MIPLKFPTPADKRRAIAGAFVNRFLIGLFVGTATLPLPAVAAGALIGFLVSLPDAIITRVVAPLLIAGTVFGAIGGWVVASYGT
jgi:hypothetical protein